MKSIKVKTIINNELKDQSVRAHNYKHAVEILLSEYDNCIIIKGGVCLQIWSTSKHYTEYATHKFKPSTKNGKTYLDKYWGHYIRDFDRAYKDFMIR